MPGWWDFWLLSRVPLWEKLKGVEDGALPAPCSSTQPNGLKTAEVKDRRIDKERRDRIPPRAHCEAATEASDVSPSGIVFHECAAVFSRSPLPATQTDALGWPQAAPFP